MELGWGWASMVRVGVLNPQLHRKQTAVTTKYPMDNESGIPEPENIPGGFNLKPTVQVEMVKLMKRQEDYWACWLPA